MDTKVLIIDDDITIAENTAEYFNVFEVPTAYVTNYDEAITFLEENEVSLILLDINLGERSGFELCKKIREDFDMPIFFISARKSDDNALMALSIGGDDYISKPFSVNLLLAKVKAMLARYEKAVQAAKEVSKAREQARPEGDPDAGGQVRVSDELILDTDTHKLFCGDETIPLTVMEYKMLLFLLKNRGRVVTKDELLSSVWEEEFIGEGTLAVHARRLREKIEKDPKNPGIIKTVWGVGYMIE